MIAWFFISVRVAWLGSEGSSLEVDGYHDMPVTDSGKPLHFDAGRRACDLLYVKIAYERLSKEIFPLKFRIVNISRESPAIEVQSAFMAPRT
ncbi:MAG: hypothetical protein KZQ80_04210 [Candidatus Thiodiazotropha sp. (ex Monitilora ramsayi)]|nr:hypothetical protein [Candidatus Thiodiazotropha sp. (ex Monitilora ramsayi)]